MFKEYERLKLPPPSKDLSEFVREVYITLNLLRASPKFFVNNFLEVMRDRYHSKADLKNSQVTLKHISACIEQISKFKAQPAFLWSQALQSFAEGNDKVKITSSTFELIYKNAEVSFAVVTNLIFDSCIDMVVAKKLIDSTFKYVGI